MTEPAAGSRSPQPIHRLNVDYAVNARALAGRVRQLANPRSRRSVVPEFRSGTVISVDGGTPPTCTVQFDTVTPGVSAPLIRYPISLAPVAGDIVYVAALGGDNWVVTKLRVDSLPAYLETSDQLVGFSTETMHTSTFLTVYLEAGRRYRVQGRAYCNGSVANTVRVRIRYAQGANPTTSSTLAAADEGQTTTAAGGARAYWPVGFPLIAVTGNHTFGLSGNVSAGGGNATMQVGAHTIFVAISEFL